MRLRFAFTNRLRSDVEIHKIRLKVGVTDGVSKVIRLRKSIFLTSQIDGGPTSKCDFVSPSQIDFGPPSKCDFVSPSQFAGGPTSKCDFVSPFQFFLNERDTTSYCHRNECRLAKPTYESKRLQCKDATRFWLEAQRSTKPFKLV